MPQLPGEIHLHRDSASSITVNGDVDMSHFCRLCGSRTALPYGPKDNFFYCPECEYISRNESGELSADDEKKTYDLHNNSVEDPHYVDFFYKFLDDAVFPYAPEGKEGLDFGSGPSPVLAALLERHRYRMDIYDKFYSLEKTYKDKKYDLITTTEVVEHLADPLHYFRLFARLLKRDGILAVMTLFHKNDPAHFNQWHYMRDPTHISFYTPKTLRYIAEAAGLEIIHTNNVRYMTFKLADK